MGKFIIKNEKELKDILIYIEKKMPKNPIVIEFETGIYNLDEINLPRNRHGFVHINGNGSHIKFKKGSRGFFSVPSNNKQALNEFMSTRYLIENFSRIEGGKYAINLCATFNSIIRNIECVAQEVAGIELRFGLMTRIENILVTNPIMDGIRIDIGNWKGATKTNSQSNHTVLEQCRVYNREGGNYSFDIIHSSGVVLRDCISEGRNNKRAINYDSYGNPVVKNFTIENFHLEHSPEEGGIWISASATTSNIIDKYYINSGNIKYPIVLGYNGPVQIKNIGWWRDEFKIMSTHHAPRILIDQCNWRLNGRSVITTAEKKLFKDYIRVSNQLIS